MLTGFFGYYLASQFDFAGLQYITAQLERLVLFTYPLFVMFLGAAIYGERDHVVRLGGRRRHLHRPRARFRRRSAGRRPEHGDRHRFSCSAPR